MLEIFELFDELRREARLSEIASRLDYPQSSASILLKNLVSLGYMRFDEGSNLPPFAHRTKTGKHRRTLIDGRTRHAGDHVSQRVRKRIE